MAKCDWSKTTLRNFAKQSNEIESIYSGEANKAHADALKVFLELDEVKVADLVTFVKQVQSNAFLRTAPDHNVWIGGHMAPVAQIAQGRLNNLLLDIEEDKNRDPWDVHCKFEMIHPFIDGNGRSGRALWAYLMNRYDRYRGQYLFLQMYYYQTLQKYWNATEKPGHEGKK